ncbi:hypothetical protein [Bifidobacterium scardovii]|uniref:Uncharacterized protein n=1 Tax=Bifidobacterium scardovii TaxID=158787 RepID=A0A087DGQ7_9BIFI|nr:hypothetical protein [Bifidobacterium scardovii]KFI94707.1 hypothetical protein BSCA_0759 [Bifidobacterium scardovii]MDK6349843.1 hypothetical protein [Bifidobacterium scardovii]MDU8982547.1 hypothetical protein [Bifidobacterium scardovii]
MAQHVRIEPRKTNVTRSLLVLLLPVLEGWCASYSFTHDIGAGNQLVMGLSTVLMVAIPFIWMAVILFWKEDS